MSKPTKPQLLIFIGTIAYIIAFAIYYIAKQNYEFMLYIAVMIVLLIIMTILHKKFNFPTGVLLGVSIWGLLHMAGGSLQVKGNRLYSLVLISITETSGTPLIRFDQFIHFYLYIFLTIIAFYLLKPHLKEEFNTLTISIILIFAGMGIGALNEIIEFGAVLTFPETGVGDYFNTAWDIVFNTLGAIVGVLYLNLSGKLSNAKQQIQRL